MGTLLEKLSGLFSGSIILSGLLPALITMAYAAGIVVRFDATLVARALQTGWTFTTLVTLLIIVALTFVFESLHPLFRRWLTGGRVPEWWLRRRQRQRLELEIAAYEAADLWNTGRRRIDQWRETVQAQLAVAARRPRGPEGTAAADRALAVRRAAEECLPVPAVALAELLALMRSLMRLVRDVERASAPWPEQLVWACRMTIMALNAVEGRLVDHARKTQARRDEIFPSNEYAQGTLFGNLMASVESYPATHYGMDSTLLWPRLREAVGADKWKALDDARSMVDFLVAAVWIHVAVLGFAVLALPMLVAHDRTLFVVLVVLAITLRFVFYRAALQALQSYGLQVATAFDLRRWALADALRLPRPATPEEERAMWQDVSVGLKPDKKPRFPWYR